MRTRQRKRQRRLRRRRRRLSRIESAFARQQREAPQRLSEVLKAIPVADDDQAEIEAPKSVFQPKRVPHCPPPRPQREEIGTAQHTADGFLIESVPGSMRYGNAANLPANGWTMGPSGKRWFKVVKKIS